jgi:hypothetical protein
MAASNYLGAATLEEVELAVTRDMVEATPLEVARQLGLRYVAVGRAGAFVASHVDVPVLNRVLGLGVMEPGEATALDELTTLWRGTRVRYFVQVVPEAETAALRLALGERDLWRLDAWAKVWRGATPAPALPTDLRVEEVGPERGRDIGRILCTCFGMPEPLVGLFAVLPGRDRWRVYAAFDGDAPVATGALYRHGDVGAVVLGATLPTHRRCGAQGAILARRIRDGLALGCRGFVAEAAEDTPDHPNPSYHNLLRAGFELAYLRRNYVHFPPGVTPG